MSPIADPGGPYVAAYLVTMYEYCMMSGRDWWDLSLAAAQTNVQTVVDKLEWVNYWKKKKLFLLFLKKMYDKVLSGLQCVNPVFRQCPSKILFFEEKRGGD